MNNKKDRTMLHDHETKDNRRYTDVNQDIKSLKRRDKAIRYRDAIAGFIFIMMSIGWNKVAYLCNKTYFLSFTYNEGWGLFQSGMLLFGTILLVWAVIK